MNFRRIQEAAKVIQRYTRRYFTLKRLKEECLEKLNSDTSTLEFNKNTLPEEDPVLTENAVKHFQSSPQPGHISLVETTSRRHFGFLSSLASRAVGSWFDPLKTKPDEFTPQNYFSAPYNRQMTLNLTRGHVSPLAMLMCNFNHAKRQPRSDNAGKQSFTIQPVNISSDIISRRDIEKVSFTSLFSV